MLTIGDRFPAFKLKAAVSLEKGKEFQDVSGDDQPGKWKVVFFWPKDFTFVCPTEIAAFGKRNRDFEDRDARVLGVSTDNEYVHLAWRKNHPDLKDLPFPMLSDLKHDLVDRARDQAPDRRRRDARHVHRRPGQRHPVRLGHRPGRRPERRRGAARAGRAADRRALPLQLAEGRTDAEHGEAA